MPEGTWKIIIYCYILYNSCKGLVRAFLERIDTVDVLSKNSVVLTHIHSFTMWLHKQKRDMRQKLPASPSKTPSNGRILGLIGVQSDTWYLNLGFSIPHTKRYRLINKMWNMNAAVIHCISKTSVKINCPYTVSGDLAFSSNKQLRKFSSYSLPVERTYCTRSIE